MKNQILLIKKDSQKILEIKQYLQEKNNFKVVAVANNLKKGLKIFLSNQFKIDIVLIDSQLDESPDLFFSKTILENPDNKSLPLIFLTHLNSYELIESAVFSKSYNYLQDPFYEIGLRDALKLALDKSTRKLHISAPRNDLVDANKSYFIKKNTILIKILEKDIHYVTVEGRYSKILTTDENFLIQLSLKQFMDIASPNLVRTHRNYIVNFNKIEKIFLKDNLILMKNGMKAIISREHKKEFTDYYDILS